MQPSKRAQLAVFFTVFVDLLGFGIVIPILPIYAKGLAMHPAPWMAWVNQALGLGDPGVFWAGATMVLFSLAQFFAGPILGRISDLVGRRPVLLVSLLGTCASYLVLGTASAGCWPPGCSAASPAAASPWPRRPWPTPPRPRSAPRCWA